MKSIIEPFKSLPTASRTLLVTSGFLTPLVSKVAAKLEYTENNIPYTENETELMAPMSGFEIGESIKDKNKTNNSLFTYE